MILQSIRIGRVAAACAPLVAMLLLAGCRAAEPPLTELQRAQAGTITVVLLSPRDALKHGDDTGVLEFHSADGTLVDVGEVTATATMPMPGAPMFGSIDVGRTNVPGRYTATTHLEMAGTWRWSLQWNGPVGAGAVTFAGKAH